MANPDFRRSCVLAVAGLVLAGCTDSDWQGLDPFGESGVVGQAAAAPVAAVPQPAPDNRLEIFCRGFAQSEAWNAAHLRAGVAEQARISDRTYTECMMRG
jgi:hypothetical protein